MTKATYELMVDWNADDVWGDAGEDVSAVCQFPISYERGWEDILREGQASTMEFRLKDPDAAYSPENATSPLYPNVKAGRPVRLRASHSAVWYPLWKGRIQKIVPHPWFDEQYTYIYCIDGMNYLAQASITTELYIQKTENYIINDILDQAGWPAGAANRAIDDYVSTLYGSIEYGLWWHKKKALPSIHEFEKITQGKFHIDGEGKAVWHDREHRAQNPTVQYIFDNSMVKPLDYEHSLDLVYNEAIADVQSDFYTGPYAEHLVGIFPLAGNMYVGDDVSLWLPTPRDGMKGYKIIGVIKTAPATTDLIVDIIYDGVSIFTEDSHKLIIQAGFNAGETMKIDVKDYAEGAIFKMNIEQIGTGTVGADLVVMLFCKARI